MELWKEIEREWLEKEKLKCIILVIKRRGSVMRVCLLILNIVDKSVEVFCVF